MLESTWSLFVSEVSVTRPILKSASPFSYRPSDGISHVVRWVGSLIYKHPVLKSAWSLVGWGVSLARPVLKSVSSCVGWGVSLTRPVLESDRRFRSLCWNLSGL